ncbi:MAG: HD domain-containing protein [Acidimicrobiales bacterium]|nr:HD domain-containing protein [Acidimicrobiales bacterium]
MTEESSAPQRPSGGKPATIAALWLSPASRERVEAAMACKISDGVEAASGADIVLISTRLPRVRMASVMQRLVEIVECPIVAVCHAGGEETASDLVRLGATMILAEGNEATISRHLQAPPGKAPVDEDGAEIPMREPDAEPLVSGFTLAIDSSSSGGRLASSIDPVTRLPLSAAFTLRFADMIQSESLPRIGFIRVANRREAFGRLDRHALDLVRRRLVMQFQNVLAGLPIELFQMEDLEFAFISQSMSLKDAEHVGKALIQIARGFAPSGAAPLELAIGHAGPEVANEPRTLRELATRAVEAAQTHGGAIVSGDELALSEANSTENDAVNAMARWVDEHRHGGSNHHGRVAQIAVAVGRELGIDGIEMIRLRLAASIHDIGMISLGEELVAKDPAELAGEELERYRSHPTLGANFVALSAGEEVVGAIKHHHENWDGSGYPEGIEGEDIPLMARVVAMAEHIEELIEQGMTPDQMVAELEVSSGSRHDPAVVWTGVTIIRDGVLHELLSAV